jgi:hypothetical protein
MKIVLAITLVALVLDSGMLAQTVNFDNGKVGMPPSGWTCTQTGRGEAQWAVVSDDTAPSKPNVLKQSGVATFPICLKDDTSPKDGFVEVKFKPVSGKEDQAGGLVWRAKDVNNYYVFRANANEDNVVLYKTVNGKGSPLDIVGRKGGYGISEKVASASGTRCALSSWAPASKPSLTARSCSTWRTAHSAKREKLACGRKRTV